MRKSDKSFYGLTLAMTMAVCSVHAPPCRRRPRARRRQHKIIEFPVQDAGSSLARRRIQTFPGHSSTPAAMPPASNYDGPSSHVQIVRKQTIEGRPATARAG